MSEPIIVTTPDGQEFEFPAGTSDDVMKSALQREFGFSGKPLTREQEDSRVAETIGRHLNESRLIKDGEKFIQARERDPDYIGWTPNKTPAQYGAERMGKWDGAFLGFGDELTGLINPEAGKERRELKSYARENYPQEFSAGETKGGVVNALATAPVAAPKALQVARFMPRGTQAATTGATSTAAWDTAQQVGTGEGSAVERFQNIDTDRTKASAAGGALLGGVISAFTRSLSNGQSEVGTLLEGLVSDAGAVSDDGVRAFETFLRNNGVPLDDVTRGRINNLVQDSLEVPSKSLSLPVRVKDVLIDTFDDGSGKFRQALETHLRGTMVQGGDGAARIAQSVDEDIAASRVALDENYGRVLGKKARIKSEDQTKEQLAEIGRKGYEPLLEAGPTSYQGARSLDEVLSGPGISKLKSPLEEIAAGEGLSLEDMIQSNPLRAAHWMQSKARQLAESSTDVVKSNAFGALRGRLLKAINDAAPEYDAVRRKYGDEFGNLQALEFGDKFLTQSRDAFQMDKMKRAFSDLSPRQKNIALLSVRDALKSASGRGRKGAAPRLARVGDEQVLDALDDVFGKRGARVAQGIEDVGEFVGSRQRIDSRKGSPTANNQEASRAASENVQSPLRRKIGGLMQTIAGDTANAGVGLPPLNALRRGLDQAGKTVSGNSAERMNAFAQILESPVRKPNTPAQTQRVMPERGPDGKFISREAAQKKNAFAQAEQSLIDGVAARGKTTERGGVRIDGGPPRRLKDVMKDARGTGDKQFPVETSTRMAAPPTEPQAMASGRGLRDSPLLPLLGVGAAGAASMEAVNRLSQPDATTQPPSENAFSQQAAGNPQNAFRQQRPAGTPHAPSVKPDISANQQAVSRRANEQARSEDQSMRSQYWDWLKSKGDGSSIEWNQIQKERADDLKVTPEDAARGVIRKRLPYAYDEPVSSLREAPVEELINGRWSAVQTAPEAPTQ